jgi:hypothetical protein
MSAPVCPVCGGECGAPIFTREAVPIFLNQVYPTPEAARNANTGRLELAFCRSCQFGFNAAFDPSLVVYGAEYENEQSYSPVFGSHVDQMIERVLEAAGGRTGSVVEVGCGQGKFLRRLAQKASANGIHLVGVDPCFRPGAAENIEFFASTLDRVAAKLQLSPPLILVSRHVIEHISQPAVFLQSLLDPTIQPEPELLLLETPSFEWIVRNGTFMDVFYEHCCYFTRASLISIATRAGWRVESVETVFGDQYYWLTARKGRAAQAPVDERCSAPQVDVAAFARQEASVRSNWQAKLEESAARGPVAVWGAAAKGVTFATLLDPDRARIQCLIDMNPAKQGKFITMSGHPVLSVQAALEAGVRTALVMNPNYLEEMRAMTAGSSMELVSIPGT